MRLQTRGVKRQRERLATSAGDERRAVMHQPRVTGQPPKEGRAGRLHVIQIIKPTYEEKAQRRRMRVVVVLACIAPSVPGGTATSCGSLVSFLGACT